MKTSAQRTPESVWATIGPHGSPLRAAPFFRNLPISRGKLGSRRRDLNPRPPLYESGALTSELRRRRGTSVAGGGARRAGAFPGMVPRRLARLPRLELPGGARVHVARSLRARLLGLAGLRSAPADAALLLPRCRSVHTLGMRFPIDVCFLDRRGRVVDVVRSVPPGRVVRRRRAAAALEAPSGGCMVAAMAERESEGRLRAALDPRVPIYRDRFNEYFVFLLSSGGAAVLVPLVLYLAMALSELWSAWAFLAASAALELALIFGIGRPQMRPIERVGWALLWGVSALALGAAFYYLVAEPTL